MNAPLILTQTDFIALSSLAKRTTGETAALLEGELDRAAIIHPDDLPADVVAMNSRVQFVDLDSSQISSMTLVYPHEANIEENKVSVLAPVGVALIGLRVGQSIDWVLPSGKKRRLKVVSVLNRIP